MVLALAPAAIMNAADPMMETARTRILLFTILIPPVVDCGHVR
jgi:hypothetical protein